MTTKWQLLLLQFSTAGIILATLLIFFPPFASAFVGDDYVQLDYILEFASRPLAAIKVFDPTWSGWYYRPLQNLWFLLNRSLFTYTPFGYYWLGLLVHGLATAVLVALGRKMGLRWETAVACGALFAIHKHYVDVVTWISAIAILLAGLWSMAAVAVYAAYLRWKNGRYLFLTFLFFLLAILSHEEAILLPPMLLFWRILSLPGSEGRPRLAALRWRMPTAEKGVFLGMAILVAAYLVMQVMRPNLTISFTEDTAVSWQQLSLSAISQFVVESIGRLLPVSGLTATLQPYSLIAALLIGAGVVLWFWRGSPLERFGIIWAVLHLVFIFATLWLPKPELFAGRHIYQAWIGLTLAFGGMSQGLLSQLSQKGVTREGKSARGRHIYPAAAALMVGLLFLILVNSSHIVRIAQANWFEETVEETSARTQIQALLPEIDEKMHIFAFRFPITPRFLRSVLQVWYERDQPYRQPFGPLDALQAHGVATPNFYLLDWDNNGRLYNLMPELQERQRTVFVWSRPAKMELLPGQTAVPEPEGRQKLTIEGPANDRRLAVLLEAPEGDAWRSLSYALAIGEESMLETAVYYQGEESSSMRFRIRLQDSTETATLLDIEMPAGESAWHEVQIPLRARLRETAVTLYLEVSGKGEGFWANPRLTK